MSKEFDILQNYILDKINAFPSASMCTGDQIEINKAKLEVYGEIYNKIEDLKEENQNHPAKHIKETENSLKIFGEICTKVNGIKK